MPELNNAESRDGSSVVPHARKERSASTRGSERPGVWVAYGKVLRRFRKRAGLTQEQLAERVGYSPEQTASIEQARRPAKLAFTTAAESTLDAGGVLEDLQEEVDLAKLPAFFRDFLAIEMEAVSRFDYDPLLVPGLLQTPEYARTLFESGVPVLSREAVENQVDARVSRQRLLTKSPLVEFSFVLGEAALRNRLGSEGVMRQQYLRLLELAAARNVSIQVMPVESGFHPGLNGPIVTVETERHRQFAYFESQGIGHFVSEPAEVSLFALRYGKLRSQALNERESAALIEELAGDDERAG